VRSRLFAIVIEPHREVNSCRSEQADS